MLTLVTGATGFIGGRIALALRARGDEVRGLVRDPNKAGFLREHGVELVSGDMEGVASLRHAVEGVELGPENRLVVQHAIQLVRRQ